MVERYEDTPEGQAMPPPAAVANGRHIIRLFGIEGTERVYYKLAAAIQGAEALPPPPPDQPEVA